MAAGHIVAGQCVDVAASIDTYYGSALPTHSAGNPAFVSTFSKSVSGWVHETYQSGTLVASVAAPIPTFATCDTTASFHDGMEVGWMVAGVMIVVYAIRRIYK